MPGRKSALEKLGITSSLLKGLDLQHGLTLKVGEAGLTLGSLGIARLGPGGSPAQAMSGTASNLLQHSPNNGSSVTSTSITGNEVAGTAQVTHADGSIDLLGWQVGDDGKRARATYQNSGGYQTGSTTYTETSSTDADGVTTTTSTTHTETNSGSSTQTTTATSHDGRTYAHTESTSTSRDGEGNSTTTNTSTSTVISEDGEVWTHSSSATNTCDSSNSCSTTTTDSSGGTRCDETADNCTGGSDTAYRDPDYIEVAPSPEVVATALIVFESRLDYYHDPTNDSSIPITLPPVDPQDVAPYILVTGDPDETPAIIDGDFFYSGGVQPDYDPTLQNPLYEKPKDPNECLECR